MSPAALIWTGILVVVLGLATANPVVIIPGVLVLATVGLARLWTEGVVKGHVSYALSLARHRAKPGDRVPGHLEIKNSQPFPVPWLDCSTEWPAELGAAKSLIAAHYKVNRNVLRNVMSLRWFERVVRRFEVLCTVRGEFILGPAELTVADPFGFFEARRQVQDTARIVVYPRVVRLVLPPLATRSPFGERAVRSFVFDDPLCLRGAREYCTTDPFSRIEWKATARTGRLQTRLVDASFSTEAALVIDVSTGEHIWDGVDRGLLERTLVVGASVLNHCLESGYRFGVYTNGFVRGSGTPAAVRMGAGKNHFRACMEVIARLQPALRARSEAVLVALDRTLSDRAHMLLVTSLPSPSLMRHVTRLRSQGRAISVVLTGHLRPGMRTGAPTYSVLEQEAWDEIAKITLQRIGG